MAPRNKEVAIKLGTVIAIIMLTVSCVMGYNALGTEVAVHKADSVSTQTANNLVHKNTDKKFEEVNEKFDKINTKIDEKFAEKFSNDSVYREKQEAKSDSNMVKILEAIKNGG